MSRLEKILRENGVNMVVDTITDSKGQKCACVTLYNVGEADAIESYFTTDKEKTLIFN